MTVRAEAKKPTSLDMGPRTMFFFIGVAVLAAVAAITAFLVFAPAPSIASSGSAQRSIEADSARWEAMAAYYAAQAQAEPSVLSAYDVVNTARELRNPALAAQFAVSEEARSLALQADAARWEAMAAYYAARVQAEPRVMSAYDANNTARELRNPALAAILLAQAPAESAYVAFLSARALRDAAPAVRTGGSKVIGSPALDVSGRGCTYDNGSRVFVCRS